jgi:hypothetical protein
MEESDSEAEREKDIQKGQDEEKERIRKRDQDEEKERIRKRDQDEEKERIRKRDQDEEKEREREREIAKEKERDQDRETEMETEDNVFIKKRKTNPKFSKDSFFIVEDSPLVTKQRRRLASGSPIEKGWLTINDYEKKYGKKPQLAAARKGLMLSKTDLLREMAELRQELKNRDSTIEQLTRICARLSEK